MRSKAWNPTTGAWDYIDNVFNGGGGADETAEKWATVKVDASLSDITDEATFRKHFYDLRKSQSRKYQFEISQGGIHENIVTGVGGRPQGVSAEDSAFIYVEIPFSEAGGYIIHVTYEMRSKAGIWEKKIYATLDARWNDTGWYQPAFIAKTIIAPHGSGNKADLTASQIINAARKGVVQADYTDQETGELRTYQYFKQMPDGRAVFAVNGYIEDGMPKQTLIYVDYAGNVTVETRDMSQLLAEKADIPGNYVLVNTGTADGRPLTIDQTDDKNPYDFKQIIVKFDATAAETAVEAVNVEFFAHPGTLSTSYQRTGKLNSAESRFATVEAVIRNGFIFSTATKSTRQIYDVSEPMSQSYVQTAYLPVQSNIKKIAISTLPKGTKYQIFGVGA